MLESPAWFSLVNLTRTSSLSTVFQPKVIHADNIRSEDQQIAGGPSNISQSSQPAEKVHPLYVNNAELGLLRSTTIAKSHSGAAPKGRTKTTRQEVQKYSSLQQVEMENNYGYSVIKKD